MMGYWNGNGMGWGGLGILGLIFWIILFIDAVLLGIWLWQQIQKKR